MEKIIREVQQTIELMDSLRRTFLNLEERLDRIEKIERERV